MKTYKFINPHPGFGGAVVRVPENVMIVANWLDGKEMTIQDAIQCLQDASPEAEIVPRPKDKDGNGCILLKLSLPAMGFDAKHCWKIIEFQ